ncbi:Protein disulfide-isomerase tigA [Daldinia childiae]|uniref:Protein disulfide-isomerase tigA n=1 Tax=Daldinia childiae TaxID=326645 RepID=UPI0014481FF8|nr:Protein disulfide-isomerase tigA [Daldinia childiae]KAF3056415.1 Protein disulfide-isomerase tigA [Daldinia childiae]
MVLVKSFVLAGLAAAVAAKSAVLDLIPSNFDNVVLKSGKPTLVEFFAPWCGHCKNLAPVYEELAQVFATSKDVQIAKVDADAERSLGQKYGVQGFPTLKWFDGKSNKPTDYEGGRDLESLTKFITDKTGLKAKKKLEMPSQVNMLTDTTFKEIVGSDKNVLVAFTAPWCGHCKSLAPTWETLAEDFINEPNVVIAKVDAEADNSKATASEQGVSSYPTIKFFPKGSTEGEPYSGGRSEKDLVSFLNEKTGTHRVPGGGLDATGGTIDALNHIALKYAAGSDKLADLAAEAKKAAASLAEDAQYKYAQYYIRVFDKLSQNEGYVAKESARLDGIIKKGGLAPSKLDEFQSKTNILKQFIKKVEETVTGDDEKEEL